MDAVDLHVLNFGELREELHPGLVPWREKGIVPPTKKLVRGEPAKRVRKVVRLPSSASCSSIPQLGKTSSWMSIKDPLMRKNGSTWSGAFTQAVVGLFQNADALL